MVYDISKKSENLKPRFKAKGKLIGITTDATNCKIYDPENGVFSWVKASLYIGFDGKEDKYLNVTIYEVNMKEMPELARADVLLLDKKKPMVELQYYKTEKLATSNGAPIMDEIEEKRGDKTVYVQKQRVWVNNRMSKDDVIHSFKILKDDMPEMVAQAPKKEPAKKEQTKPITEEGDDGLDDLAPEETVE